MPLDARLSRLARWVLMADQRGFDYGLRLPARDIRPGTGAAHLHACLEALATFDSRANGGQTGAVPGAT